MPFDFRTPWLLLGLAAAAIPVVLHLLSSVRAPEVYFPTLRFLRISVEKTARRRRLEHWLLLVIRSLLLGLLALAVSEPILRASRGFLADPRAAAVLIVDNSYSMGVRSGGTSRFDRAVREANALLGGDAKPSQAAVLLTNADAGSRTIGSDLGAARQVLTAARMASGRAALAERAAEAVRLLGDQSAPRKAVYVFSDFQRLSAEPLAGLAELKRSGIPLMLVDCSQPGAGNVGISELTISGRRVVDQPLELAVTLLNSSPTDKLVTVSLHLDGRQRGPSVRRTLKRAGLAGAKATARFAHRFAAAGFHVGHVAIDEPDDLAVDNVRHLCLRVAEKVQALLVRGPGEPGGALDPASALETALDPFAGSPGPWSVRLQTIAADQFGPEALANAQVAFFVDVTSFSQAQADALEGFVRNGGTAAFFLGPAVDAANYNDNLLRRFDQAGGLLPGRIGKAVGQVGDTARAIRAVKDLSHPYLAGLYETPADYPELLVQRYYRVHTGVGPVEKVLSTPDGDAILSAKDYHAGRVVLCATTASPEWNNLSTDALLLSMAARICLAAGERLGGDHTYAEGSVVTIRPGAGVADGSVVEVTLPGGGVEMLPLPPGQDPPAVSFTRTHRAGVYEWQLAGAAQADGTRGSFATNPDGAESDLAGIDPAALAAAMKPAEVFLGKTVEQAHAAAAEAAAGDNLWDRLLAIVILLLVVEAVVANRFRRGAEPIPEHLNPRLA